MLFKGNIGLIVPPPFGAANSHRKGPVTMQVKELRDLLADMPGEMNVYVPTGEGILSAKHIFRGNLVGVDQFCELTVWKPGMDEHTPDFQDSKIERETGFKDRDALIAAYKKLSEAESDRIARAT